MRSANSCSLVKDSYSMINPLLPLLIYYVCFREPTAKFADLGDISEQESMYWMDN